MKRLAGRVALITGASRGLGAHIARRLAREGMRLALVARNEKALQALAGELAAEGHEARVYVADITDTSACRKLVEAVEREMGGTEILINNAGIERTGHLEAQTFEESLEVVDVNLLGRYALSMRSCRAC